MLEKESRLFRAIQLPFSFDEPNIDSKVKSAKLIINEKASINTFEQVFPLFEKEPNLLGLVSVVASFEYEEMEFFKEVQVFDLNTMKIIATKSMEMKNYTL